MSKENKQPADVGFGLTNEQEASMIAEVALSVVRDRAISSLYGFEAANEGLYPRPSRVFIEKYAKHICCKMEECNEGALNVPLYTGAGELLGQLSRLLIVCRERKTLSPYLEHGSKEIARLGVKIDYCKKSKCITHLRNAVLHCRYQINLSSMGFEESTIVFRDVDGEGHISGEICATAKQINLILDVLIFEICFRYLADIGWTFA